MPAPDWHTSDEGLSVGELTERVEGTVRVGPRAVSSGRVSDFRLAATGPVRVGQRQVEELAIGVAVDFEAFYADRCPAPGL